MRRITINLAPGYLRKAGPYYDLPIAVAILAASGQVELSGKFAAGPKPLMSPAAGERGRLAEPLLPAPL